MGKTKLKKIDEVLMAKSINASSIIKIIYPLNEEELILPKTVKTINPIFDYNLVAYRLTEAQARFAFPKYRDESINWNDDERSLMPDFNIDLPFDELVKDPTGEFNLIVFSRLQNVRVHKAELIKSSLTSNLNPELPDLDTHKVILHNRKDFGNESMAGHKVHIDFYNNIVYTLTHSSSFCALDIIKK